MNFIKKTICYALFFSGLNASAITNKTVTDFVNTLEDYAHTTGFTSTVKVIRGENGMSLAIEKRKGSDDWFSIKFYRENEQSPFTLEFSAKKQHENLLSQILTHIGAYSSDNRNNISKVYEEGMVRYTLNANRNNEPYLWAVASGFVKDLFMAVK
ncbi:MAG: hypothetical protein J0M15_07290 [Deltaproteobacteria bacterium]|jgi:hypothetical protein|nr:hypothetical protein [Deltaproteobacteria bacterium]